MIFRMIGGKVIPMPNLFDDEKARGDKGVLSPLAMEHTKRFVKDLVFRPDYKCPECGCLVWRCLSVHGDSILLDLLGPPWPLHECSGSDAHFSGAIMQKNCQESSKKFRDKKSFCWLSDGWTPVFDVSLQPSVHEGLMKLHFDMRGKRVILKVSEKEILSNWVSADTASQRVYGAICFIRPEKMNGKFDVSMMDSRLGFASFSALK